MVAFELIKKKISLNVCSSGTLKLKSYLENSETYAYCML
jgi:hypothetical protein